MVEVLRLSIAAAMTALALTAALPYGNAATSGATIAFVRDGEIFVTDVGGSGSRRLTRADGDVSEFAWSPDGRTIAFVRGWEGSSSSSPSPSAIFLIAADGKRLRPLTPRLPDIVGPVWSPDGDALAFLHRKGGGFVMRAWSRRGLKVLSPGRFVEPQRPSWAPDGRRLVASVTLSWTRSSIFIVPTDGSPSRQLTRGFLDRWPQWSPDGARILFERSRCTSCATAIHLIDPGGRSARRLAEGSGAAWSPDGRKIAFQRGVGNLDIWSMDADGSTRRRLATSTYGPIPTWSPDARKIAFVRANAVFVMDSDGAAQHRLAANATSPAWRPVRG